MTTNNKQPRSMTVGEFTQTKDKWATYFYRQAIKEVERSQAALNKA